MSEILDKAVAALSEKFSGAGGDLDATVKFDIDEVGAVMVDATQSPPAVSKDAGEADVTVSASAEVFQDLMAGSLDPTSAYMGGQLRIDGDMGLAMKLAQLLA